jgi:septal ring factor EnvC (AmiA/AmiB activator)
VLGMKSKPFQHPVGKVWHQLAEVMSDQATRFDRMEGDVAVLKTDMAELKEQVNRMEAANEARFNRMEAATEARFNRMEAANEARFNRIDANLERLNGIDAHLERLIGLVRRDELKRS